MKLTKSTNPDGFSSKAGSQMGIKAKGLLECLRKNGRKNQLDLEMMLGMQLTTPLKNMERLSYVTKCRHGVHAGSYEIANNGRIALGELITMAVPTYAPISNATMHDPYLPGVHDQFQSRVSL